MSLFCKRYSVCDKCKVHFEPAPTERHAELCPEHRKPVVELEDRILRVVAWAKVNWEKLEPQAIEAELKLHSSLQGLYAQQQNIGMAGLYGLARGAGAAAAAQNPYGTPPQ